MFYVSPLYAGSLEVVKFKVLPLANGDGRAFLNAFTSRVPAFLNFALAFRVPALQQIFCIPRFEFPSFLFRVPQQKTISRA